MVVDVVQCNSGPATFQLKKVIQFVCGDAMVCDTIREAKSVAFDGPQRIKVRPASAYYGHIASVYLSS